MSTWSREDIGSMEGKTILITGGTSGIGKEAAKELVRAGAHVIIASDDLEKGQKCLEEIKQFYPRAEIDFHKLDLGSLHSVSSFTDTIMQEYNSLDVLVNNAGIAAVPERMETDDGHELTFGVNYLGHFALTTQIFPLLLRSSDPRVIMMSSLEHKEAKIDFSDLEMHKDYNSSTAYQRSKLAMLMFALELHRRCISHGLNVKSIPIHPGAVKTHIFDKGPSLSLKPIRLRPLFMKILIKAFGQDATQGALSLLFAATSVEVRSGVYYGPSGFREIKGSPTEVEVAIQAQNLHAAERLWEESERLTGLTFDISHSKNIGLH